MLLQILFLRFIHSSKWSIRLLKRNARSVFYLRKITKQRTVLSKLFRCEIRSCILYAFLREAADRVIDKVHSHTFKPRAFHTEHSSHEVPCTAVFHKYVCHEIRIFCIDWASSSTTSIPKWFQAVCPQRIDFFQLKRSKQSHLHQWLFSSFFQKFFHHLALIVISLRFSRCSIWGWVSVPVESKESPSNSPHHRYVRLPWLWRHLGLSTLGMEKIFCFLGQTVQENEKESNHCAGVVGGWRALNICLGLQKA